MTNNIDKWQLRQSISALINNSWAKCHKKLSVKSDYNKYIAQKSLFHVIRIIMYGIQIGKYGKITDYQCANNYYNEIMNIKKEGDELWKFYKEKYQSIRNELLSQFREYCPKPNNEKQNN